MTNLLATKLLLDMDISRLRPVRKRVNEMEGTSAREAVDLTMSFA